MSKTSTLPPLPVSLGKTPQIKNVEQLAQAVRCLSEIDARLSAVAAQRQAELDQVNLQWARALQFSLGKTSVPLEQYRAQVQAAAEEYVLQHKADVFTNGAQTTRFACGEVSYKEQPAQVALGEGVKPKEVADALAKKSKLKDALDTLLTTLQLTSWLKLSWSLDLAAIKSQFTRGKIDKRHLPNGLEVRPKREFVIIKPLTAPERSEAA